MIDLSHFQFHNDSGMSKLKAVLLGAKPASTS